MTKIRRVHKRQYYMKTQYKNSTGESKTKYKRKYDCVVHMVQFPKSFDVSDLADTEVVFERKGNTITLRPKG